MNHIHLSPVEYKAAIDVLSQTSQHVELISNTLRESVFSAPEEDYFVIEL